MEIENDEMIECMGERLSDDLWERYELEDEEEYEELYDKATKTGLDWFETKEAKGLLISLWKKDIELFKQKCEKLGYDEKEIKNVIKEIIEKGLKYINSNKKQYDKT